MSLIPFYAQTGKDDRVMLDSARLRIVLDEFEYPCLLIDYGSRNILTANNSFVNFTKYTLSELAGINYESLIEDLPLDDLNDGFSGQAIIRKKGDSKSKVIIEFRYIDPIKQLALIKIDEKQDDETIEPFWEVFSKKGLIFQEKLQEFDENDFISEILRIGTVIFETDLVLLYKHKSDKTGFKKYSLEIDSFPEEIPAVEVERIKAIDYWRPGKRVLTEIQRAGRVTKLRHLFTLPIELSDENPGLYIVAFEKDIKADLIQKQLLVFKNWIQVNEELFRKLKSTHAKNVHLINRNQELEFLIENISDSILVVDQSNVIVGFNTGFCNLFNYSPVEVLGSTVETILNREVSLDKSAQNQRKGENKEEKLTIFRDRTGKELPVFMEKLFLGIDNKDFWFIILQDAADYVHHSKNLVDLEKKAILGDTIADFAHEVRNPINNIATGLQLSLIHI